MKKIPNCSTWNNLKIKLFKPFLAFASVLPFAFGCLSSVASAAPAVVPVGVNLIVELLVALGVLSGAAAGGYVLSENCDPYTASILQKQVNTLTYDIPISEETIENAGLLGSVIPEDTYYTDNNGGFFVFGDTPASSLYLMASALAGVSYAMPVNLYSALESVQLKYNPPAPLGNDSYWGYCYNVPFTVAGQDRWFFPYVVTENNVQFINSSCFTYESFDKTLCADFMAENPEPEKHYLLNPPTYKYICYELTYPYKTRYFRSTDTLDNTGLNTASMLGKYYGFYSGRNDTYTPSSTDKTTLLSTQGFPSLTLVGDKEKLVDAVVEVKKPEDDDNNGSTPPAPQSPNNWEIWQTLEALVDQVETGNPTNGGTTFGQYVNNNYNYVDVDINVPEEITNNVNMSGGLDINGKGDININFNEDVSLPSAGDGSGFYNPNAADVVGALNNNNPVISGIKGLFAAIDPALVGVFSVSVSLMLVLGLWKLIRG